MWVRVRVVKIRRNMNGSWERVVVVGVGSFLLGFFIIGGMFIIGWTKLTRIIYNK